MSRPYLLLICMFILFVVQRTNMSIHLFIPGNFQYNLVTLEEHKLRNFSSLVNTECQNPICHKLTRSFHPYNPIRPIIFEEYSVEPLLYLTGFI